LTILTPYNDPDLILRFSQGDEHAFRTIFNVQLQPLCYFAHKILGQKEEAEDVVSTAFAVLWERRAQFNSGSAIKSFLYITVRNACYDLIKHRKVVNNAQEAITDISSEPDITIDARILQAELLQLILSELKSLPDRSRQILEYSFLEERKTGEIAGLLSMSEAHVRMEKSRALVLLRKLLLEKQLLEIVVVLLSLMKK